MLSKSLTETAAIAADFAKTLRLGDVVAFSAPMGAGKTTFTRFVLQALGVSGRVQSPTFALVKEYIVPQNFELFHVEQDIKIYHFDMYRISSAEDLYSTGFFEYIDCQDNILFVEWSENIADSLPKSTRKVRIDIVDENTREIEFC